MKKAVLLLLTSLILGSCKKNDTTLPTTSSLRVEGTMTIDALSRTYLLNLPPNYNQSSDVPLVIALHGGGGSATQMETNYYLTDKANQSQFAIVYPEGVRSDGILGARTWNAGTCCDYAVEKQIDDVKFISNLIDDLHKKYPRLSTKKIYATGMSNGAMMCYRLACELSSKIAAIAPVAGTMVTTSPCVASRSVPILHIHSKLDTKVPYTGGRSTLGFVVPPVETGINTWLGIDACNTSTKTVNTLTKYTLTKWLSCNNSAIQIYLTEDGGHSWPGGDKVRAGADAISDAIVANDVIWSFFQQYKLP